MGGVRGVDGKGEGEGERTGEVVFAGVEEVIGDGCKFCGVYDADYL